MRRNLLVVPALMLTTATFAACGGDVEPEVAYKPALLPVEFIVDQNGISIKGDKSIATPIGQFSIGAKYRLPERDRNTIYVTIRDRKMGGVGFDLVYGVRTGADQFSAVVNGTTTIEVRDGQVLIDVTDGSIKSVQFKRIELASAPQEEKVTGWWANAVQKWNEGWRSSFYQPFALSAWAYDDSTIDKGYGFGFIWFLARLALALVLLVVDLALSFVFLFAQIAYLFFGPSGRNIVWGVAVLGAIVSIGIGLSEL